MDPYQALGVNKNATEAEIKKAYRKLAHKHHPDKEGGDDKRFKEATEAYEILSDKQRRAQYDQFGATGQGFGGGFGGFEGFQNVNFDFSGGGFGDIFDSFFGGSTRHRKKGGVARGSDIEIVMQLTFEEAVFGTTKEVELSRLETCETCKGNGAEPGSKIVTCETCQGTGQQVRIQRTPLGQIQTASVCNHCQGIGQIPEKKCKTCTGEGRNIKNSNIKVKVPAGIHNKAAIRLSGKGEAGNQGGSYGDLFVHISIEPSKTFERIGNDIHTLQNIHVLQAILGDEIVVKTIHDKVNLKIPAGTENGRIFKIKEKGVLKVNTDSRGDHYVKIMIDIPKKLSKKERELYNLLADEADLKIKYQNKGLFG